MATEYKDTEKKHGALLEKLGITTLLGIFLGYIGISADCEKEERQEKLRRYTPPITQIEEFAETRIREQDYFIDADKDGRYERVIQLGTNLYELRKDADSVPQLIEIPREEWSRYTNNDNRKQVGSIELDDIARGYVSEEIRLRYKDKDNNNMFERYMILEGHDTTKGTSLEFLLEKRDGKPIASRYSIQIKRIKEVNQNALGN